MSFDLPHMQLMQKARQEGRDLEREEICEYIRNLHPEYAWLANAIKYKEHK